MQMHAMNRFGGPPHRGFGGQPQPQRQGGRRGNNRGGFGGSRFEHNQRNGNNQNQGQRPNEQNKPAPQAQQQTPAKPAVPQQTPAKPAVQQQTPAKPVQQQTPAKPAQDKPDASVKPEAAPIQNKANTPAQKQPDPPAQSQPSLNGTSVAGPKQGGWSQGNKPFNQQGGNKPFNQQGGDKPYNQQGGDKPYNQQGQQGGNKPYNQQAPKPLFNQQASKPQFNQQASKPQFNQGGQQGGNKPFAQQEIQGPQNSGGLQSGQGEQRGGPGGNRQFGGRGNQRQGWGQQQGDMKPGQREEHMLANKLKELQGPILDLPPLDYSECKFNGRSRLYIGNLTNDVTEEEIMQLFSTFGEAAELFINKEKNFGFIKMDYRVNAEKAKRELDGQMRNGRSLRVRFAPHNSAVRVRNLPPFVSNELLYRAFEIFGKIERAYVKVDERGKSLSEGVVEFQRKPSALAAIRNCTEKCFFLTASLRPVIVDSYEEPDEVDGYPERNLPKKHPEFQKARELGPRFSEPNSFEHEYGTRWKQLHELQKQKEEALRSELAAEEDKLEAQMEFAKYEHETEILREQLRQREQDRERTKQTWEQAERAAEERREQERTARLRTEHHAAARMRAQDDELRRRQQENTLFVQAQRLNSMLDRQEQGIFDSNQSPMDGGFREPYELGRGYDDMQPKRGWEGPRNIDDFQNKRRRLPCLDKPASAAPCRGCDFLVCFQCGKCQLDVKSRRAAGGGSAAGAAGGGDRRGTLCMTQRLSNGHVHSPRQNMKHVERIR